MMNYYAIQIAARTIRGESRGESEATQLAVTHVIINRLMDGRWGKTLAGVCRAPMQFSCWNPNDPNRVYIEELPDDEPGLLTAVGLIGRVFMTLTDPTFGAKWYKNTGLAWPKDWGPQRAPIYTSGKLEFFNLDPTSKE